MATKQCVRIMPTRYEHRSCNDNKWSIMRDTGNDFTMTSISWASFRWYGRNLRNFTSFLVRMPLDCRCNRENFLFISTFTWFKRQNNSVSRTSSNSKQPNVTIIKLNWKCVRNRIMIMRMMVVCRCYPFCNVYFNINLFGFIVEAWKLKQNIVFLIAFCPQYRENPDNSKNGISITATKNLLFIKSHLRAIEIEKKSISNHWIHTLTWKWRFLVEYSHCLSSLRFSNLFISLYYVNGVQQLCDCCYFGVGNIRRRFLPL